MKRLSIVAVPLILLAGCGGEEPAPAESDEAASAAGEVLEGSTSDAMLPYGNLRSQPPLAEIGDIPESEGGQPSRASGDTDEETGADEGEQAGEEASTDDAPPEPAEAQPAD